MTDGTHISLLGLRLLDRQQFLGHLARTAASFLFTISTCLAATASI